MNPISGYLLPSETANLPALLRDWREDTMTFLHHDMPKLLLVMVTS